MNRNLYLVTEGRAELATPATAWDGIDSVLVLAIDDTDALDVADAYDRGEVQADNAVVDGVTVGCVRWDQSPAARRAQGPVVVESGRTYLGWRARLSDEATEEGGGWTSYYNTQDDAEAAARDYAYRKRGLRLYSTQQLRKALDDAGTAGDLVACAALQIVLDGDIKPGTAALLDAADTAKARAAAVDLSWLETE